MSLLVWNCFNTAVLISRGSQNSAGQTLDNLNENITERRLSLPLLIELNHRSESARACGDLKDHLIQLTPLFHISSKKRADLFKISYWESQGLSQDPVCLPLKPETVQSHLQMRKNADNFLYATLLWGSTFNA